MFPLFRFMVYKYQQVEHKDNNISLNEKKTSTLFKWTIQKHITTCKFQSSLLPKHSTVETSLQPNISKYGVLRHSEIEQI